MIFYKSLKATNSIFKTKINRNVDLIFLNLSKHLPFSWLKKRLLWILKVQVSPKCSIFFYQNFNLINKFLSITGNLLTYLQH